jgi:hypothetical protein
MPSVYYGTSTYERDNGNLPRLSLINMFVEKAKTSENEIALLSRSGLGVLATIGSGPIVGLFSKQGTFNGDVFGISSANLYRGTTSLGTVAFAGSGIPSWAGSDTQLVVTRGSTARLYNGTTLSNITFPDGAPVRAVAFIGSLFVYVRGDSAFPGRFYWSDPLSANAIDGLAYATAERQPDALLDIVPLGGNIWLFGQQSIEAWAHTGAADLPFTRLESVAFDKGIHSTGAATPADNSIFFVGSDLIVYRVGETMQRVSDHSIEARIGNSTTCRLFSFTRAGHEFVCVRLDAETLAFDCASGEWTEFQTAGGQWIVQCAAMVGKLGYFGHHSTGQILGWDEWDDLGVELERRFTAAVPLDEVTPFDRLSIWANTGQTPLLEGQGSEPVIEMRSSDDGGNRWSDWEADSLGAMGEFRQVPEWRALGLFDFPGAMFEFRVTDPVPLRISAVKINERGGGASRD